MQKLYFPPSVNIEVYYIECGSLKDTYMKMPRCPVYEKWLEVQDIVGPASEWPRHVRRTFWGVDFTHWRRIQMCVFVWVNGLHPEIFLEWLVTVKACQMGDETTAIYTICFITSVPAATPVSTPGTYSNVAMKL